MAAVWSKHLELLACPACHGALQLAGEGASEPLPTEIESGILACGGCQAQYPVRRGVPRFLEGEQRPLQRADQVDERTRRSFGYEWLRYPVTTAEEDLVTFFGLTGIEPAFYDRVSFRNLFSHRPNASEVAAATTESLRGARVLDAGCGMGKYVQVAAAYADTVIGLDASDAVERAREVNAGSDNVLIVQGDIFAPPLRPGLDLVFSVGVLHHTCNTHQAFLSVARLVRSGGRMAVWLYPRGTTLLQRFAAFWHERLLRPLTCRLPLTTLEQLCAGLGRLTVAKTRLMQGGVLRRSLARVMNLVAVGEHHDPAIAAFLNFDWYSPRYRSRHDRQQLQTWFEEAGFGKVQHLPVEVSAVAERS